MKKIILVCVAVIATVGSITLYDFINPPPALGTWQHVGPGEYISNGYVRLLPPPELLRYMSCSTGDTLHWTPIEAIAYREGTFKFEYKVGSDGDTCINVLEILLKAINEVDSFHGLRCWPDAINLDKDGRPI